MPRKISQHYDPSKGNFVFHVFSRVLEETHLIQGPIDIIRAWDFKRRYEKSMQLQSLHITIILDYRFFDIKSISRMKKQNYVCR